MDLSRPHAVIAPTLDPGVLSILARTSRPLTGREIARLLGRPSHSGVIAALDRLVSQGLVEREEAGRAFLFTLNREHLAAPAAELLADLLGELASRVQAAIDEWKVRPEHVSLFGSAARGDGSIDSDIDLFIVRSDGIDREEPRWRDQLDLLARRIEGWTGNPARVAEVGQADVALLAKERPPVVEALLEDAITLTGPPASTLLEEP